MVGLARPVNSQNAAIFDGFFVACPNPFRYTERTAQRAHHPAYKPISGGHVTFQVGDKVIYPNHGLGVVQGIETKTILGTTCGFYHLRMVANETTVLVPVDNVDGVGLRRAINDEEIERLFSLLGDGKIDNHQNWKGRFKDNSDRMRTGSIYDVVEVLKSLTFLARSKNLSFREKRMLDRAKFLVVSEISEVSHEITAAIEEKVDRALDRCFTTKNRSIAGPRRQRRPQRRGCPPVALQRHRSQTGHAGRSIRDGVLSSTERAPSLSLMIAALRSAATYLAVALYVLLAGPPALLIAITLKEIDLLYRVGHLGVRLGLALSGMKVVVEGAANIQRHRAAVYAVNHASNVEPPIIFDALHELFPRLRIVYKAELRKLPVLVRAFDLAGFVPLQRGKPEQSLPAIDGAAQALRDGNSFLIFPEGTRSRTGELLPFKKGGFILALKGQSPVVPIAISGSRSAMRKGSPLIYPVTVRVRIGEPVETSGMTLDDRDALVEVVRGRIQALLAPPSESLITDR